MKITNPFTFLIYLVPQYFLFFILFEQCDLKKKSLFYIKLYAVRASKLYLFC